jgi:hypothetical protein
MQLSIRNPSIITQSCGNIMILHNDILSSSRQLYDKSAQSGKLLCFTYASFVRERVEIISVPPKIAPVIKGIN